MALHLEEVIIIIIAVVALIFVVIWVSGIYEKSKPSITNTTTTSLSKSEIESQKIYCQTINKEDLFKRQFEKNYVSYECYNFIISSGRVCYRCSVSLSENNKIIKKEIYIDCSTGKIVQSC